VRGSDVLPSAVIIMIIVIRVDLVGVTVYCIRATAQAANMLTAFSNDYFKE